MILHVWFGVILMPDLLPDATFAFMPTWRNNRGHATLKERPLEVALFAGKCLGMAALSRLYTVTAH